MGAGALVGSASSADNGVAIDRVNQPGRPGASGAVSPADARTLWLVLTGLGLVLSFGVSAEVGALAAASAVALWADNRGLKGYPLVGNLVVAAVIAAAPLLGALAVGAVPPPVMAAVGLTFGIVLAREIAKDVEGTVRDALGDARARPVA